MVLPKQQKIPQVTVEKYSKIFEISYSGIGATVFPLPLKTAVYFYLMILKWWIFPKNNEWFCRFIKGNLSFIYVKSLVSFVLRTCRPLFIYFGKWLNSFRGFIKVFKVEEMILQKINFEKIKMQTLLTAHTSWSACNRVDIFLYFSWLSK